MFDPVNRMSMVLEYLYGAGCLSVRPDPEQLRRLFAAAFRGRDAGPVLNQSRQRLEAGFDLGAAVFEERGQGEARA